MREGLCPHKCFRPGDCDGSCTHTDTPADAGGRPMAQHPSGAELVAAYDDAVYAADQAIRLTCIDGVQREDEIKARDTARSAIIALIDDPVRAADLELLEAWRLHVASGEVSDEVAVHWRAWNQLRAAIAKAQAPADAEGTK